MEAAAVKVANQLARPGEKWVAGAIPKTMVEQAIAYAELAQAAYGNDEVNPQPPAGWTEIKSLGMDDTKTGFRAVVFYNATTNQYVVAFAGTQVASGKDWWANFKQAFDNWSNTLPTQYGQAMARANDVIAKAAGTKGKDDQPATVVFVGHSLGGGLASLAAIATKNTAYTFNAAGLNKNTLANVDENLDINDAIKYINSFRVLDPALLPGDLLSGTQHQAGKVGIMPPNTGLNRRLPPQAGFAHHWHGMGSVIASLTWLLNGK